jgi:taurine dioxygenase
VRTGKKGLFVNPTFTSHIKDMTLKESDAILGFLYEHCVRPEYTVRKRWSQGDVGFWDNRCTMHYALADYGAFNRVIQRVTIEGEKPV